MLLFLISLYFVYNFVYTHSSFKIHTYVCTYRMRVNNVNHRFYDDTYFNKKEFYDINTHFSLLRQGFKYIIDFKGTCIPRSQISKTANILYNL